jgi:hypothetical protein
MHRAITLSMLSAVGLASGLAQAQVFSFNTGNPDGRMAAATRPESTGSIEIECADDFLLTNEVRLTSASFVGLIPAGAGVETVQQVVVEIYRVFPLDSDTARVQHVPTRNNSPSDIAFASRDSQDGSAGYYVQVLGESVAATNSVVNGIHQSPNQQTNGEGPVSGREVKIAVTLNSPIDLPAGHYFFVPQVLLASGQFLWLSAPKPIVAPGTPFTGDLQAWIRNSNLDPDWLRVGTDIVGGTPAPTFNMTFSIEGSYVCYANCDASTVTPALNVNDFTCFLNRFASGDPYANCDNSTTPPVLNVLDFYCFLNSFAAGCS